MSLSKYRAFLSVARNRSFTSAAQEIQCTQSAASRMILDLEEQWGVQLFVRQKKSCTLTREGEQLLPYVQSVIDANSSLKMAVSAVTGLATGTVRIGAFASIATFWLPRVIKEFEKRYPGIRYEILMGDFQDIEDWTRSGFVDFGFTTLHAGEGITSARIAVDELKLVLPKDHPLASRRHVHLKDLDGERFMLLEKRRRSIVTELLERENVRPEIILKTFEDHAILGMVREGLGMGILPSLILDKNPEDIAVRSLTPAAYRSIYLIRHSAGSLSLAAEEFLKCFGEVLVEELEGGWNSSANAEKPN